MWGGHKQDEHYNFLWGQTPPEKREKDLTAGRGIGKGAMLGRGGEQTTRKGIRQTQEGSMEKVQMGKDRSKRKTKYLKWVRGVTGFTPMSTKRSW